MDWIIPTTVGVGVGAMVLVADGGGVVGLGVNVKVGNGVRVGIGVAVKRGVRLTIGRSVAVGATCASAFSSPPQLTNTTDKAINRIHSLFEKNLITVSKISSLNSQQRQTYYIDNSNDTHCVFNYLA